MKKALHHMAAAVSGEVSADWWPRNEDIGFAHAAKQLGAAVPSWERAAEFSAP